MTPAFLGGVAAPSDATSKMLVATDSFFIFPFWSLTSITQAISEEPTSPATIPNDLLPQSDATFRRLHRRQSSVVRNSLGNDLCSVGAERRRQVHLDEDVDRIAGADFW